jgi:hypothetical protein
MPAAFRILNLGRKSEGDFSLRQMADWFNSRLSWREIHRLHIRAGCSQIVELCQAEIQQLHRALLRNHDISGFEIALNNALLQDKNAA